jgi:hypothetical protein
MDALENVITRLSDHECTVVPDDGCSETFRICTPRP